MTYLPTFVDELKGYIEFYTDCTEPYLKALDELITGKREGRDLTLDELLDYKSAIDKLKENIQTYKVHENEKLRKFAEELEKLVDTKIIRAYTTLLIRKKDEIMYAKEMELIREKELMKAMQKRREAIEKEAERIPEMDRILETYGVKI
jgi:hypothetical protein